MSSESGPDRPWYGEEGRESGPGLERSDGRLGDAAPAAPSAACGGRKAGKEVSDAVAPAGR